MGPREKLRWRLRLQHIVGLALLSYLVVDGYLQETLPGWAVVLWFAVAVFPALWCLEDYVLKQEARLDGE